ncbi:MAG: fasciclin domain-containing protein [Balneolaceae bacterium]
MKYHIRNFITGLLSVAIMTFISTGMVYAQNGGNGGGETANMDVVEVIQSSDEHTIFADLLRQSELANTLKQEDSVTVIAPTDDAFNQEDVNLDELRQNPQELESFLEEHIEYKDEKRAYAGDMERRGQEDQQRADKQDQDKKEVINAKNGEVHSVDKVKKDKDKKKDKNQNKDYNNDINN